MARKQKTSPGAREIQRERFRMTRDNSSASSNEALFGNVLPQVMKKLGLEQRFWEQSLINEWEHLVGPQVAKYSRPGRLDRKVLHIFVTHPAWLSELSRYGQKQLLANLQARFGADRIKSVRLQLDPDQPGG